ncbi:MAG: hypothetical protein FWG80_01905 [Alphaproteobacteria bacterium]|nr:hypothetical protein [Alphaproteobacteria bacterium]
MDTPKIHILSDDEVTDMFRADWDRVGEEVRGLYSARIDMLNLSESERKHILYNIQRIIVITRKYIYGIEQKILHPIYYQAQSPDELRQELKEVFGGENFIGDIEKRSAGQIASDIIFTLLEKKDPARAILDYVETLYKSSTKWHEKLRDIVEKGSEIRRQNNTSFPAAFGGRDIIYARLEQPLEPGQAKAFNVFSEISDSSTNISMHQDDRGVFYIDWDFVGTSAKGRQKLSRLVQKFNSFIKDLSKENAEKLDCSDIELLRILVDFHKYPYSLQGFFALSAERAKEAHVSGKKRVQNQKFINFFKNNPIFMMHISKEMYNMGASSDMDADQYRECFTGALEDLSGKYAPYAEEFGANTGKAGRGRIDIADLLVFSKYPWDIATQNTYQDWQTCMHALGTNAHMIQYDIGYGGIACFGRNSNNPGHNIFNAEFYPARSDSGKTIYRNPNVYGKSFGEIGDILQSAFNQAMNIEEQQGIYKTDRRIYLDGAHNIYYIVKNADGIIDLLKGGYLDLYSLPEIEKIEILKTDPGAMAKVYQWARDNTQIPENFKQFCKNYIDNRVWIKDIAVDTKLSMVHTFAKAGLIDNLPDCILSVLNPFVNSWGTQIPITAKELARLAVQEKDSLDKKFKDNLYWFIKRVTDIEDRNSGIEMMLDSWIFGYSGFNGFYKMTTGTPLGKKIVTHAISDFSKGGLSEDCISEFSYFISNVNDEDIDIGITFNTEFLGIANLIYIGQQTNSSYIREKIKTRLISEMVKGALSEYNIFSVSRILEETGLSQEETTAIISWANKIVVDRGIKELPRYLPRDIRDQLAEQAAHAWFQGDRDDNFKRLCEVADRQRVMESIINKYYALPSMHQTRILFKDIIADFGDGLGESLFIKIKDDYILADTLTRILLRDKIFKKDKINISDIRNHFAKLYAEIHAELLPEFNKAFSYEEKEYYYRLIAAVSKSEQILLRGHSIMAAKKRVALRDAKRKVSKNTVSKSVRRKVIHDKKQL